MTYLERTQQLQAMLDQGQDMAALDQFFHEDLVVTEKPTGEQRHGLTEQKKAVEAWYDMVASVQGAGTSAIAANEETGVSMAETWAEMTFKAAPGPSKIEEVVVYRWKGDRVKAMDFYYHNPMGNDAKDGA